VINDGPSLGGAENGRCRRRDIFLRSTRKSLPLQIVFYNITEITSEKKTLIVTKAEKQEKPIRQTVADTNPWRVLDVLTERMTKERRFFI